MKRLYILLLILLLPLVLLVWLMATESGLRWVYQQAEPYLPAGLSLNAPQGKLIGPVTLENVEFEQDGMTIKAGQIIVDWHPGALLVANVDIDRVRIKSLSIALPAAQPSDQPVALPEIFLPWRIALKDVQIDDFSFSQDEQMFTLRQIRLSASTLLSKVDIEEFSLLVDDSFSLNIKGELRPTRHYRHDLDIHWRATLSSGAMLDGSGALTGDMQRTHLKQQLRGPLQLRLDTELSDLLERLHWQGKVNVSAFDLSQLDSQLPALSGALQFQARGDLSTATATGTLDGNYPEIGRFDADFQLQRLSDNAIQVDQLTLQPAGSDMRINSHGVWTPGKDGGQFNLALDWQNLRWPLQQPPLFNSASGNASVTGTINHYQLQLSSESPWPELLPSSWSASAEGNLDGLNIRSLTVAALEGEATASGQLNWSPALNWQLKVSARDINPARLAPAWPGQLAAKITSTGQIKNGLLVAEVDITQLTGKLRNYPVSLKSKLNWHDNGLDIALLDFHSGKSQVNAKGRIAERLNLDWSITADNLAELYPQAQGQLHAEGRFTGPYDAPGIQTSFKGQMLALSDYRVGTVNGNLNLNFLQWQQLDINLAAQSLELAGSSWQSLAITSTGQQIEIKAISEKLTALAELQSITDAQGWHGRLEKIELDSQQIYHWQLKTPASLDITENTIRTEPICLASNDGEVCIRLHRHDELWQAKIDAEQIPLMLFAPWLPADLKLNGKINANAELSIQRPEQILGNGKIELLPGTVSYPLLEGERELWEYQGGTVAFAMNEQGINSSAEVAMSNGDRFHFKAELPGAQLLTLNYQHQSLHAGIQLSVHDMGLIEALLPEIQDLKGEISLNLSINGTLTQPQLSGKAQLLNAALRIPRLGLNITQLSLNSQSQGSEKFGFRLKAHSGEGDLIIKGQTLLNSDDGWPTAISIKGNEFEVAQIPEARIVISPDLQIEQKNHNIKIRGNIHVPQAKLQPKDITTAVRVSEDAEIIGGEKPAENNWLIDTKIRLTLGERVHFFGFGFEGRLGGSVLLEDEPGYLTKATGEINIPEGRYRAYGQRLDIELGRLLFTGGPPSNPGLDLRAVRHVGTITTGIKVRGSLQQPQLELFSTPAMGQTDMLAYLLLGAPIENASGEEGAMMAKAALAMGLAGGDHLARTIGDRFGLDEMRVESSDEGDQASLVVGRYLSPRLYVSYGVGLVEAFNTLTLRYKISSKWQIKAESGEYQGADILYTFER